MFNINTSGVPRHAVTCACGHVYKFRIHGRTAAKREETMRWLAAFPCPDCEKKQKSSAPQKWAARSRNHDLAAMTYEQVVQLREAHKAVPGPELAPTKFNPREVGEMMSQEGGIQKSLEDCSLGDAWKCKACGAPVVVASSGWDDVVDVGYECGACGKREFVHLHYCECEQCEVERQEPIQESRRELIKQLRALGWEVKASLTTESLYAEGIVDDERQCVRISDHERSIFRELEFGQFSADIRVSTDWTDALLEMPELDNEQAANDSE